MLDDWIWHSGCDLESIQIFSFTEVYKTTNIMQQMERDPLMFSSLQLLEKYE